MSVPVLGLNRSKFTGGADLAGRGSACAVFTGISEAGAVTFISTGADQVAIVDGIDIMIEAPAVGSDIGDAVMVVTVTINGQTMDFCAKNVTGRFSRRRFTLRPRGTLIVNPSSTLTMRSSAGHSLLCHAFVQHRKMPVTKAIAAGYYNGTRFAATVGSGVTAATPVDLITAATVTASRCMRIRGVVISGHLTNATGAANQEILLEFTDGAATHRKFVKNCYGNADPDGGSQTLLIDDCVITGPAGYGVRATFGQTGSNARVAIWGEYVNSQETWPGTGLEPGASDAVSNAGKYFWIYSDSAASDNYDIMPSTTLANSRAMLQIDGVCASISGNIDVASVASLGFIGLAKGITGSLPLVTRPNGGGTSASGANTFVFQNLNVRARADSRAGFTFLNAGGAGAGKAGLLVWGRFGGNVASDGYTTTEYTEA